jgi:hypothetical protein
MPVGPLSLLVQGSLALAVSALTQSMTWGVVAAFIPFAGWTIYFYSTYPVWFGMHSVAIDFLCLLPFALGGAVHSFFWEAHVLMDGSSMYRDGKKIDSLIQDEAVDRGLKPGKSFVQRFLVTVFWRCMLFLAVLIAAHVPMELNWAATHILAAMGITLAGVLVSWVLFYALFIFFGTPTERLILKNLFNTDGELIPFTVWVALANLLYVLAYGLLRYYCTTTYWEAHGWWIVPLSSGSILAAGLYGIGQCMPLRHSIDSQRKDRRRAQKQTR